MFVLVHGKKKQHHINWSELRKWASNNAMLTLVIVIATVLVKFYHSALTTLYSHSEITIIEIYTSKAI